MTEHILEVSQAIWEGIKFAVFAAIGGIVGYLLRNPTSINFTAAIINGVSAGFVGQVVMLICTAAKIQSDWVGVIVGVSGLVGAQTTYGIIESIAYEKLGIKKHRRKEDKEWILDNHQKGKDD